MPSCWENVLAHRRAYSSVVGGFLVHATLGTTYTFGNMISYFTSYIRAYSSPKDLTNETSVWVFAASTIGLSCIMFLGGIINNKIGPRWTTLLGCWLMSAGTILTYFTIKVSFGASLLTYGVLFGLGVGIGYSPPMACGMQWLPARKGLVNGIILAGFGAGAFVFTQLQTALINPNNLSPDEPAETGSSEKYFSKKNAADVLGRVPENFLIIGGLCAVVQLIGCMLLFTPPSNDNQATTEEEPLLQSGSSSPILNGVDKSHGTMPSVRTRASEIKIEDWSPIMLLKSRYFYILWGLFLVNGLAIFFMISLYKAYGETFIFDDQFMALLGAFAAVFNAGGRIMWGLLIDRFSFKVVMVCLCSSMIFLMMTLILSPEGGKLMFFVWICAIYVTFSGNFCLFPTVTAKSFGHEYVAVNYGLIYTSQAISAVIGALLVSELQVGWFGMFCLVSGFAGIGLILALCFNKKNQNGRNI